MRHWLFAILLVAATSQCTGPHQPAYAQVNGEDEPKECNIERPTPKDSLMDVDLIKLLSGLWEQHQYDTNYDGIIDAVTLTWPGAPRPEFYAFAREPLEFNRISVYIAGNRIFAYILTDIIYKDLRPDLSTCDNIVVYWSYVIDPVYPEALMVDNEQYRELLKQFEKEINDGTKQSEIKDDAVVTYGDGRQILYQPGIH